MEGYGTEVVASTADTGKDSEVEEALEKALATGVVETIAEDPTAGFVEGFAFPAV